MNRGRCQALAAVAGYRASLAVQADCPDDAMVDAATPSPHRVRHERAAARLGAARRSVERQMAERKL